MEEMESLLCQGKGKSLKTHIPISHISINAMKPRADKNFHTAKMLVFTSYKNI
jgi:hypothetical protein